MSNYKLKINITKEILERSKRCGLETESIGNVNRFCAIALAVRDIFPDASVESHLRPWGEGHFFKISLPVIAHQFIDKFDLADPEHRIAMQPFSFEIEIPDELIDTFDISDLTTRLKDHPTLELIAAN